MQKETSNWHHHRTCLWSADCDLYVEFIFVITTITLTDATEFYYFTEFREVSIDH